MTINPLHQHFRQPKIYVKLPSGGIFNKLGSLQGDASNMPVYGMTGMDEIIMKTPDALLSGESIVRVIQSCCANVKDAWEITTLDMPLLIAAVRIATYGATLDVSHTCVKCGTENDYEISLSKVIEFYNSCKFDNILKLPDLTIHLKPLTYKESTDIALRNFQLQQRLVQVEEIIDKEKQQKMINELFEELGRIQNDVYFASVESVETSSGVVNNKEFINEWLANCDAEIFDAIKLKNETNAAAWSAPKVPVVCTSCGHESKLGIELDQSNFFVKA